jgi:hypothetical protein
VTVVTRKLDPVRQKLTTSSGRFEVLSVLELKELKS